VLPSGSTDPSGQQVFIVGSQLGGGVGVGHVLPSGSTDPSGQQVFIVGSQLGGGWGAGQEPSGPGDSPSGQVQVPSGEPGDGGTQVKPRPGASGVGHTDGGGCTHAPSGPADTSGAWQTIALPDGSVVGGGTQVPSGASANGNWQTVCADGVKIWPAGQDGPLGCGGDGGGAGGLGVGCGAAEACPQRRAMAMSARWPRAPSLLAELSSSSTK
jgi:hypothetical protein